MAILIQICELIDNQPLKPIHVEHGVSYILDRCLLGFRDPESGPVKHLLICFVLGFGLLLRQGIFAATMSCFLGQTRNRSFRYVLSCLTGNQRVVIGFELSPLLPASFLDGRYRL